MFVGCIVSVKARKPIFAKVSHLVIPEDMTNALEDLACYRWDPTEYISQDLRSRSTDNDDAERLSRSAACRALDCAPYQNLVGDEEAEDNTK